MYNFNKLNNNENLKKARLVREKRAEVKKALKRGHINLDNLFNDIELFNNFISNMKTIELVSSLQGIGRVNAEKILRKLNINFSKKVGGLGKNQKENFIKYFKIKN
jgi:hypothetical protein